MTKKKSKKRTQVLFEKLERITAPGGHTVPGGHSGDSEDEILDLDSLAEQPIIIAPDTSRTLRMKKFRTQLLHQWLVSNFEPCRTLDIGGGKGLLAHLLIRSGWEAAVVDPVSQPLPDKYKDIGSGTRVKVSPEVTVPRIDAPFDVEMAREYDLLLGMHAHGSNAKIIDAAGLFGCGFVIFPCCVIDEPFFPRLGVHWIEALADYALFKGQDVFPFRINFKGQNIGLCHVGKCKPKNGAFQQA